MHTVLWSTRRYRWRVVTAAAVIAFLFYYAATAFLGGSSAGATHVTPRQVDGNPNCVTAGYGFGFKINQAPNGTFTFTAADGELTGGAPSDPGNSVTISNSNGITFDWSATLGLDAVIVKGGSEGANIYDYSPEEFSDTGLHTPTFQSISHIEFCYDYDLDVSKDANPSFTRTFEWDIEKSVNPDTWDLFTGDSGTSEYTVSVTKSAGVDSDWTVSGTITIENNTPFNATVSDVSDVISGGINAGVDCGAAFPINVSAGGTLNCAYEADLPDGTDRVNTATVSTTGAVGGGEATADVEFGDPTTLVNDEINVDDTFAGDLGTFSNSDSVSYQRTFTCGGDEGTHGNTATIVETGQSDSASVTVNCHELDVSKDADTSFTRTWEWTIEKSADHTDLLLSEGQSFDVTYEVEVDASAVDSEAMVKGTISVHNPAPIAATINGVADVVSPDIVATVDCGVAFPHTLTAGATLECDYSADLPDAENRTNTATATQQNYDYDPDGNPTAAGTTDYSGSANVDFSNADVTVVDECIDVDDDNVGIGSLGTVCAGDAPETFTYSLTFSTNPDADVVLVCGDNSHDNTASFVTNDSGTTGDDSWTVDATVACIEGCTLTPGYWKTHSDKGPAPFDDTWDLLPNGSDTAFFLSGQTYYDVLWTPPKGNAYYNLSFHYIAAELNMLNGADVPADVQAAFDDATVLFETYTPAEIAALKGKNGNELRAQFIDLAGILGAYNEGLIGPGHCDEDGNSAP